MEELKTELLRFERISGSGEEALYDLYVNGVRVGEALTMGEVLAEISEKYEGVSCD